MKNLADIVNQLRSHKTEREWSEFKVNWFEPNQIGEYISAISNSASCAGKKEGYFVWGVNDETHEIEETNFDLDCDVKNEQLKHFLARQLAPDTNFEFAETFI